MADAKNRVASIGFDECRGDESYQPEHEQRLGKDFDKTHHPHEHVETEDAKFDKALDHFQPLLINVFTCGGTWKENNV